MANLEGKEPLLNGECYPILEAGFKGMGFTH
jgi:hypothetical protein